MKQGQWRWLGIPWSDGALLIVIVLAAAAPTFLLNAADAWQAAAQDGLAAQVALEADPGAAAATVQTEALLDTELLAIADREVHDRLATVDRLEEPVRTSYTFPTLATLGGEPAGLPVRLLGRAGALDDVEIVAGDPAGGGVWVSSWAAEQLDLALGDTLAIELGATGDVAFNDVVHVSGTSWSASIGGIYQPLWTEDGAAAPPEWADVPSLIPRYLSPFGRPSFALVLVSEEVLWSSGLSGVIRWSSAMEMPTNLAGFRDLRSEYRGLELAISQHPTLAPALSAIAVPVAAQPALTTAFHDEVAALEAAVGRLDDPLDAVRRAGIGLGFAAMLGAGLTFAERRRSDFALLASEGDRWMALTRRTAIQLALPVLVGSVGGALGGLIVARVAGPSEGIGREAVRLGPNLILMVLSLAMASLAAGIVGQGTLERPSGRSLSRPVEGILLAVAAVLSAGIWIQVGETSGTNSELGTVVAPVALIATTVGLALFAFDMGARRCNGMTDRFGLVGFLAWRRLVTTRAATRIAAGAVGLGVGMLTYSALMAGSIDRAVEARAATEVGASTRLDVFGELPDGGELPTGTSLLRVQDTRLTPGGERLRVVAIDTATFVDAVEWPDSFGTSAANVVELLEAADGDKVPAFAVLGEGLPDTGGFGVGTVHPYMIVGRANALPLAGSFGSTLLIEADRLDELALDRAVAIGTPGPEDLLAPSSRFRAHLLSNREPDQLADFVEVTALGVRRTHTISARLADPDTVAIGTSLDYQRLLGAVAGAIAAVGLVMMIGAHRRRRRAAHVMASAMGAEPRQLALATALEIGLLVTIAASLAVGAAVVVSTRLFARLDPTADIPPAIILRPTSMLIVVVVGSAAIAALGALATELMLSRSSSTLDSHDR